MATAQLPENIERPLLLLDRQVRDAVFTRGLARLILVVAIGVGSALVADGWLCLSGTTRGGLLAVWALVTSVVAWHQVIRPMFRPVNLAELAALVEGQFPELKERLTSLVEFRTAGAAPGASKLMRDLMTRQTVKAVEQLDLHNAVPTSRSPKVALAAVMACVLLLGPFMWDAHGYGLLWARFLAPWGNFSWGGIELLILDGDQVAARGSDVAIAVEVRRRAQSITAADPTPYWLHWTDAAGASDSRRLEWDAAASRFTTTLPHIFHSITFQATTHGAQSRTHRIHVADPPSIASLHVDLDPPAYTGLPAKSLDGAQGEVRAAERSRVTMQLKFNEPVSSAELSWPADAATSRDALTLPLKLAADKRSATVAAVAIASGKFAFRLKNGFGLTNTDPARSLVVDPDLPPAISLAGSDDPVAVRPDDRQLVKADIRDDHGLVTVELHLETSTGQKQTTTLPAELLRSRQLAHDFPIDLADLALTPGQAVTYRLRAVDNRPVPEPQETWTKPRTLMIQSTVTSPLDPQVAEQQQSVDDQIESLRHDLADAKHALAALHAQTEKESLQQQNSDKSEQLDKLERQQAEIAEKLQQLAAELAQNRVTAGLADRAANIAEQDVADAIQKLDEARAIEESRDQLAPLSQSIDRLTAAEKQLRAIETQVTELQKLEQDLADLDRLANKSDRLAEQLDQLDQQAKAEADTLAKAESPDKPASDKPGTDDEAVAREERRQQLESEGQKLASELSELLRKHPELLDAARQEQEQRLAQLAEQARQLAKPQQQLVAAFEGEAATVPASATKPANVEATEQAAREKADSPENRNAKGDQTVGDAAAKAVRDQQQLAAEATRQAIALAKEHGADSAATQAAANFAKRAAAASRQAQAGQLDAASEQAEAAAQAGDLAAKSLAVAGEPASEPSQQAHDLAQRQHDLAEQLAELAPSAEAQRGAQQQGQEQLARAAESLSKRLAQASEELAADPFNAQPASDAAAQAQQSASQAKQSMERAAQARQSNDAPAAAEQAALAVEQLKQAASEAEAASPRPTSKPRSSVPPEVASEVAEAARELQQAQKKLSECNCNKPGGSKPGGSKSGGSKPGAASGSEPDSGSPSGDAAPAGEQPAPGDSESQLAQTAEQFRQASAALRRALHGEQQGNEQAGTNSKPGQNQPGRVKAQAGELPTEPSEPGQAVASGAEDADLGQLDSQLKQQAQRNWGKLPGQLRTEIMQGANKKPHPEYAKQIKSYFEEIAKPATKEVGP